MKLSKQICNWIKQQVKKTGKKGVVVGLSGGIDSAVTVVLAQKALGGHVMGLILPCESNLRDARLAFKLAKNFKIKIKKINLTDIYRRLRNIYPGSSSLAKANLKPRLRMLTLYYLANSLDYLVAGTGNKSELMVGYFTKYGDGGCDILPLGDLLKTEVRLLAKELKILPEIINRVPTAGLWDSQTDEGEIGMSYEELDSCLRAIEKGSTDGLRRQSLCKTKSMIETSRHKRDKIPIFKKR